MGRTGIVTVYPVIPQGGKKRKKKKKRKKDKEAQPAGHRHSETDREKQSERLSRDKAWTFTLLENIAVGKPNTATQTA